MDELRVSLTPHERDACDEMRGILGLRSDEDLVRAALYKLAAWCEPDVDCSLFSLGRRANRMLTERVPSWAISPSPPGTRWTRPTGTRRPRLSRPRVT